MPLRLSTSRAEYGTLADWQECVEVATRRIYGTPGDIQQEWAETFHEVPPREVTIGRGSELRYFEAEVCLNCGLHKDECGGRSCVVSVMADGYPVYGDHSFLDVAA